MLRFFLLFMIIQLGLFTAELMQPVQQLVVIPFTEGVAAVSATLVELFDERVVSQGIVLRDLDSGFAVAIQAGCNGVEAIIVLVAAIVAFPSPWKHKILGILFGFFAIQAMNMARIISLFYLGQWNKTAFDWAHLYIWQALIMLDVLIVFLVWLRMLPGKRAEVSDAGAV